jgi:hypothetical protein
MPSQKPLPNYDSRVTFSYASTGQQFGDSILLGHWFVFVKPDWIQRTGFEQLLTLSGLTEQQIKPAILFRGKAKITLPGVEITPTPLPQPVLASITCDKQLYRVNRDTVRLLIAAPLQPGAQLRLKLRLSGNPYADYPLTLDEYGLCLWSMRDLPEGEYEATLDGLNADACRFEIAEYRLAALNAELTEQQLSGNTLSYTLSITAFGQPYTGPVEIELQERGQRVGQRTKLRCDRDGLCRGSVKLTGQGPYTLNVIVGERTASVALKGSEQQRRETLTISELGKLQEMSLLPLPDANECRGMYIAQGGANTEPFLVQRLIGSDIEVMARTNVQALCIVTVNPTRGTSVEKYYEQVTTGQQFHLPVPPPYGIVLLAALIDGKAWEGWCAALRPSELQLQCEAPQEAKPGSRITITLKTGILNRAIPVQLIVKDQRLIAPSDPQVELAAAIKKNLTEWEKQSGTGIIERQLSNTLQVPMPPSAPVYMAIASAPGIAPTVPFSAPPSPPTGAPRLGPRIASASRFLASTTGALPTFSAPAPVPPATMPQVTAEQSLAHIASQTAIASATTASTAMLAKVRLQFPEIIYNALVHVQGEANVEVKLGDSMTRYTVEAFAFAPETLDWERAETSVNAVQPVYGELTVSPFVFPSDPVMGRLDVGASSGSAFVEVRHDGELLPLVRDDGTPVTAGEPIPSGTVLRFPVLPGAITATVRDAQTGEVDASERYITEPGKLRHIARRLRLLTPGDEVTLQELHALEIRPLPGLEQPFQFFVEGAAKYPFG